MGRIDIAHVEDLFNLTKKTVKIIKPSHVPETKLGGPPEKLSVNLRKN